MELTNLSTPTWPKTPSNEQAAAEQQEDEIRMAMMTEAPTPTLTYETYMAEPEVQGRYDIVNGVRVFQPEVTWRRQRIIIHVSGELAEYERATSGHAVISPFDVLIRREPLQIRQPDLLLISHARLMAGGGPPKIGPLEIGPELLVEIVTDGEGKGVLRDKIADYIAIGVDECWVVRPNARTVEVLRLTPDGARGVATYTDGQTVASVVFAGLAVPVADVFAP